MTIRGQVEGGVIVLEGGVTLPEGTEVIVFYKPESERQPEMPKPVIFPLVRSDFPGTLRLTADRVAELLQEDDVSPRR